jgi:hypothetical protein
MSLIIVSCRKNFTSDQKHGDGLLVRAYPQPTDERTFRDLDLDELSGLVDGRHVAILVHGYRNPMRNVLAAYGSIQQDAQVFRSLDAGAGRRTGAAGGEALSRSRRTRRSRAEGQKCRRAGRGPAQQIPVLLPSCPPALSVTIAFVSLLEDLTSGQPPQPIARER